LSRSSSLSLLQEIHDTESPSQLRGYLLGSIHLFHSSFLPLIDICSQLIPSCVSYCGEMDLSLMDQEMPLSTIFMEPLAGRIKCSASQTRFLLKKFNISLEQLNHYPPPVALSKVFSSIMEGTIEPGSVDAALTDIAMSHGLKMMGLEAYEVQQNLMAELSDSTFLEQLENILHKPLNFRRKTSKLIKNYAANDLTKIYAHVKRSSGLDKHKLVYRRNKEMALKMHDIIMHSTGNVFFSVGAGHLPGNYGMMRYLKQHGYKLKPINFVTDVSAS